MHSSLFLCLIIVLIGSFYKSYLSEKKFPKKNRNICSLFPPFLYTEFPTKCPKRSFHFIKFSLILQVLVKIQETNMCPVRSVQEAIISGPIGRPERPASERILLYILSYTLNAYCYKNKFFNIKTYFFFCK